MGIDDYRISDWIPAIVLCGSENRKFICTIDGSTCICTKREHPALVEESQVEYCYLEDDTMLIRRIEWRA